MVEFNKRLLTNIPPEKIPLAKLILFCIYEDLNLHHFFTTKDGKVVLSDDLEGDTNDLVQELYNQGILEEDYLGENTRLVTVQRQAVFVTTDEVARDESDIGAIRKYWLMDYSKRAGIASTIQKCQESLDKLMATNPNLSFDTVLATCKYYVDEMTKQGKSAYIMHCNNFLCSFNGDVYTFPILDYMVAAEKATSNDFTFDRLI